jgi:hypothetical protein
MTSGTIASGSDGFAGLDFAAGRSRGAFLREFVFWFFVMDDGP